MKTHRDGFLKYVLAFRENSVGSQVDVLYPDNIGPNSLCFYSLMINTYRTSRVTVPPIFQLYAGEQLYWLRQTGVFGEIHRLIESQ
jgi:hypothetical protein